MGSQSSSESLIFSWYENASFFLSKGRTTLSIRSASHAARRRGMEHGPDTPMPSCWDAPTNGLELLSAVNGIQESPGPDRPRAIGMSLAAMCILQRTRHLQLTQHGGHSVTESLILLLPPVNVWATMLDSSVGDHSTNQRRRQCDHRTTSGVSEDSNYLREGV